MNFTFGVVAVGRLEEPAADLGRAVRALGDVAVDRERGVERDRRQGERLERESCYAGPNDANLPMHSCGSTAIRGCSWLNLWANVASFSLGAARRSPPPAARRARSLAARRRWAAGPGVTTPTQPKEMVPEAKTKGSQKGFHWVKQGLESVSGVLKGCKGVPWDPLSYQPSV